MRDGEEPMSSLWRTVFALLIVCLLVAVFLHSVR